MALEAQADDVLMQAVVGGHLAALRKLLERHQQSVRRLALHMLRDPGAADDVAQDVFLKVHAAAARYKPRGQFRLWLLRLTSNACLDRLRRRRREPAPLDDVNVPADADEPADALERRERARRVRQAIDDLPARQRIAVLLHRYEGLSHERIASAQGWSRSAVESLLVRAYTRLREALADLL